MPKAVGGGQGGNKDSLAQFEQGIGTYVPILTLAELRTIGDKFQALPDDMKPDQAEIDATLADYSPR